MPQLDQLFSIACFCSVLTLTGCKKDRQPSVPPAIEDGSYAVSPLRCKSSGQAPEFPDALKKALLQQFDDVESHRLTLSGAQATEEIKSRDCSLNLQREVMINAEGRFGFRDSRKSIFAPADCSFLVKFDGGNLRFGKDQQILPDRDQPDQEELPFNVESKDGTYLLTSVSSPELDLIWAQYGCAALDQVQLELKN